MPLAFGAVHFGTGGCPKLGINGVSDLRHGPVRDFPGGCCVYGYAITWAEELGQAWYTIARTLTAWQA
jgi:hypothetical protein